MKLIAGLEGEWLDCERHSKDGQSYKWFSFHVPVAEARTKSIVITGSWKDQGFGASKGMLAIVSSGEGHQAPSYLEDPESNDGKGVLSLIEYAPHEWETFKLEIDGDEIDHDLKSGEHEYEVWFRVGGGGGHELFVKDLSITIEKKSLINKLRD